MDLISPALIHVIV